MRLFDKNDDLVKWIAISLALHLLVITLFNNLTAKPRKKHEFYTPSYQVDLVTLDKAKPAPQKKETVVKKTTPPPPAKKVEAKVKAKENELKKVNTKKVKPLKKESKAPPPDPSASINQLRKKHAQEMAVEEKVAKVRSKVEESRKADTSAPVETGAKAVVRKVDTSNMDREIKGYHDIISEKIMNAWALPGNANYSGLSAIISVTIGKGGKLIKVYIEEGSGNGFFDQSGMRAVEKSAPFPPLPTGYEGGMEIGFRFKQ